MGRFLAAAVLLSAAACASPGPTVLLVRHAEKGQGRDPDLTGDGVRRSLALIEKARGAGVAAAFHTPFRRTAQTVEPAATHLGVPLIQIDYTPGKESEHADALLKMMTERYPGQCVLYAGHTTTLPAILKKLGVESPREIPETEYGTLFWVRDGGVIEDRFDP
jgi:phosphohistidine phosphatase SixA